MDNLVRLRHAQTQVVKIQRRIWIVQVLFWPAVTIGALVIAVAGARRAWRHYSGAPVIADDAAPTSTEPS